MKEQVKRLCKEQGMTLKDLAEKIGIARESLTRALGGNPTLSTIQGIAKALNVNICKLFEGFDNSINGYIEYQGKIFTIKSKEDLMKLAGKVEES